MIRWLAMAALWVCAIAARADGVPAEQAAQHVGETVTVTGTVFDVFTSKAGNVFLNFNAGYPNQAFSVAALVKAAPDLLTDGGDWLKAMAGKRVIVTGVIRLYKGKPEIVLTRRDQITAVP